LDEELGRIMAVTIDDIDELIAEFPFQPRTIVRLGPKEVEN
jgi:predicted Zn-dependent peptidase